jgi:hypothetical protein
MGKGANSFPFFFFEFGCKLHLIVFYKLFIRNIPNRFDFFLHCCGAEQSFQLR